MFKSKKPSMEEIPGRYQSEVEPGAREFYKRVGEWTGRLGEAYGQPLIAELTPEQEALLRLGRTITPYTQSELYTLPRQELMNIISGKYTTTPTEGYRLFRRRMLEEELPEAQAQLRRALALRGTFASSAAERGERDLLEDLLNRLAEYQAQEYVRERERQAAALPMAMQLAEAEAYEPLTRAERLFSWEDIARQLEQARLSAAYTEWQRQRAEPLGYIPYLLQAAQTPGVGAPTYIYHPGSPSLFSQIAPLAGAGIGFLAGGPAGAMIGSTIGGGVGTLAGGGTAPFTAGLQLASLLSPYATALRTPAPATTAGYFREAYRTPLTWGQLPGF